MSFSRVLLLPLVALALLAALALRVPSGEAQELLQNGGFEQGTSGWTGSAFSTSGCTPHSGNTAVTPNSQVPIRLQQRIAGPFGEGTHKLTVWLKQSGSNDVTASLVWLDSENNPLRTVSMKLHPGPAYTQFSLAADLFPGAASLRVGFDMTEISGTICFDDVSVDGPPPSTATPSPTETATATETVVPSATPSETATPTHTPTPAKTGTSTATPSTTRTPEASATPDPGLVFVNGGFDQGLYGWHKYGGELSASNGAGVLSSGTASTKWAYQTVAVDPARYYEFAGSLRPDGGVASAFLRISWYASADGSGSALSTTDSIGDVSGPSGSYETVTTGPVQPPEDAHTARVRVMLAPVSDAPANLLMDNFSFGVTAAPTATPRATASPTGTSKASATGTPSKTASVTPTKTPTPRNSATAQAVKTQQAAAAADEPDSWDVSPTPGSISNLIAEVSSARKTRPPGDPAAPQEAPPEDGGGSGVPIVWLVGFGLLVVGLGGAYWQGRRRE